MLFHVEHDPSEARPLSANVSTHKDPLLADVLQTLQKAYDVEVSKSLLAVHVVFGRREKIRDARPS